MSNPSISSFLETLIPIVFLRVNRIIKTEILDLQDDHKIYWLGNPIAYLVKGKDYLSPKLELLVDEAIDPDSKERLKVNLEKKTSSTY